MLIQMNDQIEVCTVKPFGRPMDYNEPMLWCKVHGRNGTVLRKLVIPAAVLARPIMFRKVRYAVVS